ncbi:3-phosphoshikimate 1-carboxyvinyltransferase [Domibacillus sp. DTU_2020_1001157_1_SI_ALB_TIR_016]|uniref:3-phosphoshikimate 1-carboxyvinyltransferase n=1 Tax=Domibacillus sp. DTU_2020_1001157_1_SI_ALB_TIR_016 TaxID=3077789 RepID=UPI0028E264DB|nr:3-phosphoshikimate 1-carboxyvinyltransferase [Domibacillus sp. DTU_2020_1001157_1_SI_ALB_TIR_016]WNS82090.1 3-phosphoshikimate 1-carboxyvinyltransferase [Domibacillus sp. DTU_2020_1001157_1_SI_ALB_TIR_016]
MKLTFTNPSLGGRIEVPGDKSISHRSIMFGALAEGRTAVRHFLKGEDCLSTIDCFRKLGVQIEETDEEIIVHGKGWEGLQEPSAILDTGNSGTTTRLMLGILAGRPFHSVMIGDESIGKRPMDRVTVPLANMGADIAGRDNGRFTPLSIRGRKLNTAEYRLPVASAQVKSAVIFAALQADGESVIIEPEATRDHTEKMIEQFGGQIRREGDRIIVSGGQTFQGTDVYVPGDISSAAFFMVAAAITPNSEVVLENTGLNETRTGIIDVMKQMGADITIEKTTESGEEMGTITVRTSQLKGIEIGGSIIPRLIDEIPIIALLATQAEGETVIRDAEELKVKETNRIDTVVNELKKLRADIEATEDGMIIRGKSSLHGGSVSSHGDHRIGMVMAIASLLTDGAVELENHEAIAVSYPEFFDHLNTLVKGASS